MYPLCHGNTESTQAMLSTFCSSIRFSRCSLFRLALALCRSVLLVLPFVFPFPLGEPSVLAPRGPLCRPACWLACLVACLPGRREEGGGWPFLLAFRPLRVAEPVGFALMVGIGPGVAFRCLFVLRLWHRRRGGIREGRRLLVATECERAHGAGCHRIDGGHDGGDTGDVHRGGHFLWHLLWCLSAGPEPLSCPLVNSLRQFSRGRKRESCSTHNLRKSERITARIAGRRSVCSADGIDGSAGDRRVRVMRGRWLSACDSLVRQSRLARHPRVTGWHRGGDEAAACSAPVACRLSFWVSSVCRGSGRAIRKVMGTERRDSDEG